jgi:hypothetical protein
LANIKNLKRGNPDTQFKSGREQVEISRKGGKASAASKAKQKTMKEAAQAILNGKYTDDHGIEITGMDKIILTLFKIATDESNRQCISAIRLLREMTGEDITADQLKLMEKKIEQIDADIAYRKKATEEMGWD